MEEAHRDGTLIRQLVAAFKSLGLTVAILIIVVGITVMDVPYLVSMALILGMFLGAHPIQKKLNRTINPGGISTRIDKEDARVLWDDVVNAPLISVLQNKATPVDRASTTAALRGWNHTRYVGTVAQELRTNTAQP